MAGKVDAATDSMVRNLEEKTGRAMPDWVKLAHATKITKHGELVKHLQGEHGLTYGYANLVAHATIGVLNAPAPAADEAVDGIYSGEKTALRPIHDAIMTAVNGFGSDVELAPKKGYVSLRRKKQFGLIQPTTKTRVDVGINLKGEKPTTRLEASGSFNAMVSHRVRVERADEVDAELIGWLRAAYDAAG